MGRFILNSFLPGVALIVLAFYTGTQKQPLFALAGFLSFFVMGITLIIEGFKNVRRFQSDTTNHPRK